MPSSRGSSWPRDQNWVSCVSCIGRGSLPLNYLGSPKKYNTALKHGAPASRQPLHWVWCHLISSGSECTLQHRLHNKQWKSFIALRSQDGCHDSYTFCCPFAHEDPECYPTQRRFCLWNVSWQRATFLKVVQVLPVFIWVASPSELY